MTAPKPETAQGPPPEDVSGIAYAKCAACGSYNITLRTTGELARLRADKEALAGALRLALTWLPGRASLRDPQEIAEVDQINAALSEHGAPSP